MERQPQNPEFRNNPENFHPCNHDFRIQSDIFLNLVDHTLTLRIRKPLNEYFCKQ